MFDQSGELPFILSAIVTSIVGGIASWFMSDEHSIFQFITAVFLAGFAGFLVGELCIEYSVSNSMTFFLCGGAGLSAEFTLKFSRKMMIKKVAAITGENIDDELAQIENEYNQRKKEIIKRREALIKVEKEIQAREELAALAALTKKENSLENFLGDK